MIVKPKNKVDAETDAETDANRRKRRADRNRMRTIKHVHKLLDQVQEGVSGGFNHLGWSNAANALKQVSAFLSPQEYSEIGVTWRETYAAEIPGTQLEGIVSRIKKRIEGGDQSNEVVERDPWERQSRKKRF